MHSGGDVVRAEEAFAAQLNIAVLSLLLNILPRMGNSMVL